MLDFSRFEALTFDCYGTLIDWETGILGALRPVLERRGLHAVDDELLSLYARLEAGVERGPYVPYREVLGRVMEGVAAHFSFPLEPGERGVLAESLASWPAFPDSADALERLARRYALVICSNIDDDLFVASRAKLRAPFERVVTAQYCRSYKPDPRHFRVAMALLDLPADRVLHVAESLAHDVVPAKALGMTTVWVNRRAARGGAPGASGTAPARPDLEVPDMATLAHLAGV